MSASVALDKNVCSIVDCYGAIVSSTPFNKKIDLYVKKGLIVKSN